MQCFLQNFSLDILPCNFFLMNATAATALQNFDSYKFLRLSAIPCGVYHNWKTLQG